MKAKHFRKLRAKAKYYIVDTTWGLFGDFRESSFVHIVLALNHRNACERAKKRGFGVELSIGNETSEKWGKWKVRLQGKPDHFRHNKYY